MIPLTRRTTAQLLTDAKAAHASGNHAQARNALQSVLETDPNNTVAHAHLSTIAWETGDVGTFSTHLDRALTLAPKTAALWQGAADRYGRIGQDAKALSAWDNLVALDPKSTKYRADRARFLQSLGRFEEAETALRKLIKRHPNEPELYRIYLAGKKVTKGDPILRQMLTLWKEPRLSDAGRMHLGFALAKAMEDIGARDKVFGYLRRANDAQLRLAPPDEAARAREVQGVLAAQDGDLAPLGSQSDPRPVFVTGMPRSGTTLVEQIIAAHSQAHAGGEMRHSLQLAYQRFGVAEKMAPISAQPNAALQDWAQAYLALAQRDSGATTGAITDKSIQSFLLFGLIHRALPGARIIVVKRDPRDVALSIYKNHFALGTHRYACDLASIARAIKEFRACVAHWQARLPGVLHEVHYENLVSDPEPQARALIAAAGLEWEDACLQFHKQSGAVQTLSLAQVRQPIHAGRREAWRAYEAELQPFIDEWGDEPWD